MAFSQTLEKHPRNSKAGTMLGRGAGERRREGRAAGEIAAFPMVGPGPWRGGYGCQRHLLLPQEGPATQRLFFFFSCGFACLALSIQNESDCLFVIGVSQEAAFGWSPGLVFP